MVSPIGVPWPTRVISSFSSRESIAGFSYRGLIPLQTTSIRVGNKVTPTSREERVAFAVPAAAWFAGIATSVQQLVKQSPAGRSGSGHRHVGMTGTDHLFLQPSN